MLLHGRDQARQILDRGDDVDTAGLGEQRRGPLAYEIVVLGEHDPEGAHGPIVQVPERLTT
ncbi:MAG: hypothetical protein LC722_02215 [Actinobacteria bacterium]|nr:hypothetical protein [Actinomycetota bacterium]